VWIIANGAYNDFVSLAETFRKQGEGLEWIVFRVAMLEGKKEKGGRAGYVGKDGWGINIAKGDIANWAITEAVVEKSDWIGKTPALY